MKWFVPGRLEVLGKRTDYAGGRSLLAAVDRGVTITLEDADEAIAASTTAVPGRLRLLRALGQLLLKRSEQNHQAM